MCSSDLVDGTNIIFTNVTSKYLPNVSSFLSFWEKHIQITNGMNDNDEYEIDELATLYKNTDKKINVTDTHIINMISHFFSPQVEVINNKYISNIRCNLWLKDNDVNDFLESYKFDIINGVTNITDDIISFDYLYTTYKTWAKAISVVEQRNQMIVSKQFFEKILKHQLSGFIEFDKFVSSSWFNK